jgi:hypothetical protein
MDVNVLLLVKLFEVLVFILKKIKIKKHEINLNENYPTDINKLRSFIPSGEAFISEFDLFFPLPTPTYDPIKKKKKIVPHWQSNSIYYYSIKYLKKQKKILLFIFYNVLNYIELFQKFRKNQN